MTGWQNNFVATCKATLQFSSALALAIALAGCGNSVERSDGGSGPVTPTGAPTVILTASSTSAESGAQLSLMASGKDNVGEALAATVTCSGGTVDGGILTLPTVSTVTDITCTAQATDKAGMVGRTTLAISVAPPSTAKLALATDSVSLKPGEVGGLSLTAIPLTKDEYEGRIGNMIVKLRRVDPTTLAFALPTGMAVGNFNLSVDIDGKAYVAAGTVETRAVVTDAKAEVLAAVRDAEASLAATVAALPASASSLERGQYTQALDSVRQAMTQIDGLSATDLQTIAEVLAANDVSPGRKPASADIDACATARGEYASTDARIARKQRILILATAGIVYTGITSGGITAVIGGITLGITILELKDDVGTLLSLSGNVIAKCVVAIDDELIAAITGQSAGVKRPLSLVSQASSTRIGFSTGVARDFSVRRTYDVIPDFAASLKPQFLAAQQRVAGFTFLPDSVRASIAAFQLTRTELVDAARITVGGPSNPNVTGGGAANGKTLRLTYRTGANAAATEDFQFTLSDPTTDFSTVILASISSGAPKASAATARVQQDQPVSIPVQVEFATSLEVATQPKNGSVTVDGLTGFVYRPRAGFTGDDSFTYVAVNSAGRSEPATVAISVQRDFAGIWNISYRSTTTSGANLCGAESFSGQINVVRQSDTSYSFSIVGNTVTLRQNSANDPAGLTGSATLTYPEDNGTTTSNITVTVPTATSLSGTSNWRWVTSGGQSCSGTGSFTGSRP